MVTRRSIAIRLDRSLAVNRPVIASEQSIKKRVEVCAVFCLGMCAFQDSISVRGCKYACVYAP